MAYLWPEAEPLAHYSRGRTHVDEVVLHESVTHTRTGCVAALRMKRLGVHLIVDRDGSVTQHVPLSAACAHAEGFGKASLHNERSVAVELVNRYYGAKARDDEDTIEAVWAHRGSYILPTPIQCESVWMVLVSLERELGVDLSFPGWRRRLLVGPRAFFWGRLLRHEIPGVMAHHRWDHADGLYSEHYCLLRSLQWAPSLAWQMTLEAASSGKRWTPIPEITA